MRNLRQAMEKLASEEVGQCDSIFIQLRNSDKIIEERSDGKLCNDSKMHPIIEDSSFVEDSFEEIFQDSACV